MIDIISAPKLNEVFQNSAPIPIHVRSTNGEGYYFTLTIYVNTELYTVLTISKKDIYNGEIDLQNIIQSVFDNDFVSVTTTQVTPTPNLLKQVDLVVKEYSNSTNALMHTLELPLFHLVHANDIQDKVFNKLQTLSVYNAEIRVPIDGLIQLPFFANETTTVKIVKGGENVFSETISNAFGVYNFQINLADYNLQLTDQVTIIINSPSGHYFTNLNLIDYTGYNIKLLAIQNNFNAWEYFYAFGSVIHQSDLEHQTLKINDYVNKKYNVIKSPNYKINTGFYGLKYVDTIADVLTAYKVLYYLDDDYIEVEIRNKKTTPNPERENIFDTTFELYKNQQVTLNNAFQFTSPAAALNFNINGTEGNTIEINKANFLNNYAGIPTAINFPTEPQLATVNIFNNGVSSAVVYDQDYDWEDFEKITITGTGFGFPWTSIPYRINSLDGYSNTAKAVINLLDDNPYNEPPVISLLTETTVFVDSVTKTITATVTDPEDEGYTVLWSQVSGDQITMTNTTSNSLQVSNWNSVGEYEFKIRATDLRGDYTEKTIKLTVMDYKVNVGVQDKKILIYGGAPDEEVRLDFFTKVDHQELLGNVTSNSQKVEFFLDAVKLVTTNIMNGGLDDDYLSTIVDEPYISLNKTFPSNGIIELPITAPDNISDNIGVFSLISINVLVTWLEGPLTTFGTNTQELTSFMFDSNNA